MRKHFLLIMTTIMILAAALLTACGNTEGNTNNDNDVAQVTTITDMAGREVAVPNKVDKVYTYGSSGQISTIMLYCLDPDKLLGWNYELNDLEKAFILEEYHDLTVYGMGDSVNYEAIIADGPQLVVTAGKLDENAIADADALQEQLGIPVFMLSGDLQDSAAAFRLFGQIIGNEEAGNALADYADKTFAWLDEAVAAIPEDAKVTVYYGNGENSLNTAAAGSTSSQVLEMVGAVNVADLEAGSGNRMDISKEQILAWDPQVVILNGEPKQDFTANMAVESFMADPDFANVTAVKNGQVYGSPKAPFSWIDRPPGPNRLIGLYWAFATIYPDYADFDLDATIREFYQLFYHTDLTDEQMELLLNA